MKVMSFVEWMEQRDRFSRPRHGGRPGAYKADTSDGFTDMHGFPVQGAFDMMKPQTKPGFLDVGGDVYSQERGGIPGVPGSKAVNHALFGSHKVRRSPLTGSGPGGAMMPKDKVPAGAISQGGETMVMPDGTPIYHRGGAPYSARAKTNMLMGRRRSSPRDTPLVYRGEK
jgi:hypothetical protein